jgi:hypothetical protein
VTSRDEAYAVLVSDLLGHSAQGRRIYAATAKVEGASVSVATWMDAITVSGGPGWLFFVDDVPKANWTHACRYVLVGQDGAVHVQKAMTPPSDMAAFTELTTWPQSEAGISAPTAKVSSATAAPRQSTPAANRYAVIISGGWDQYNNHVRYWNDCAFFYNTLKQHGFSSDHITVLYADGTDPAVDRSDGVSSPLDFDGDSVPDINYSATRANIATVFTQLGATLGANDILYIFTTDHGGAQSGNVAPYNTPNVVLYLWGEIINGDELAAEVNKVVNPKAVLGIFEQCFSGGMVEKLAGTNRVVMSASRWWELSYAMGPDYTYDEFSYYVTTALADASKGDTNGDGIVTMEEAYLYALARDSHQSESLSGGDNDGEHPAYRSDPWDLGRTLSLGGIDASARPPILAGYSQFETDEAFPTPDPSAAQGWHADDATWSYALPFPFPLAGTIYSNVSVSSNGHSRADRLPGHRPPLGQPDHRRLRIRHLRHGHGATRDLRLAGRDLCGPTAGERRPQAVPRRPFHPVLRNRQRTDLAGDHAGQDHRRGRRFRPASGPAKRRVRPGLGCGHGLSQGGLSMGGPCGQPASVRMTVASPGTGVGIARPWPGGALRGGRPDGLRHGRAPWSRT